MAIRTQARRRLAAGQVADRESRYFFSRDTSSCRDWFSSSSSRMRCSSCVLGLPSSGRPFCSAVFRARPRRIAASINPTSRQTRLTLKTRTRIICTICNLKVTSKAWQAPDIIEASIGFTPNICVKYERTPCFDLISQFVIFTGKIPSLRPLTNDEITELRCHST